MNPQPRRDTAWLEAQYNNRARVPDYASYLARWAADSAAARGRLPGALDIPYGASTSERLDVFAPPGPRAPVLVFIHGGWWRSLDKADHSFIAAPFVQAGAMVVVPNYALCPAVGIDHIALQMTRSIAWVWQHAGRYGGDPRRIVVAGHSAGGHLAALMLQCRWPLVDASLPVDLLRGGLAVSGVFELEPLRRTPSLQADLRLTAESAQRLSPAYMPPPAAPLIAVAGGDESEEFQRHRLLLRRVWGKRGVPVCEAIPATNHFSVLDELARPGSRLHELALGLLFRD